MYNGKTVAVVVPCYNEESQIERVIKTMPDFVDRIVVVDDGSTDDTQIVVQEIMQIGGTKIPIPKPSVTETEDTFYSRASEIEKAEIAREDSLFSSHKIYQEHEDDRVVLITQENSGVGAAIAIGYKWCRDMGIDCTAVMAGDGQMDPSELQSIIAPVINEGIDYVKGNRLIHKSARIIIPKIRFWGNSILSILTKIASGYWNVSDTQTGYTAISLNALQRIPLHDIYKSYGCPNDILVKLNMAYCTLREVPIKPVYNIGEQSKMKIGKVIPRVSWLLLKSFFLRIGVKYFIRDFHPLSLFYFFGIFLAFINIPLFIYIFIEAVSDVGLVTQEVYNIFVLLFISSFQSIGFAMWMDIQNNEKLYK